MRWRALTVSDGGLLTDNARGTSTLIGGRGGVYDETKPVRRHWWAMAGRDSDR